MNERIEELKEQLISVLTELNKIRPVQFVDIDCDNGVFNFSDVKVNEDDDRVYVEIAMWHDNLPAHVGHPLKDGRGRDILPQGYDTHKYVVALATGGLQEDPEIRYSGFEVVEAPNPQVACAMYNSKHNCNFFYASVIGEVTDNGVHYSDKLRGELNIQAVKDAVAKQVSL